MDFTLQKYEDLLVKLQREDYAFMKINDYFTSIHTNTNPLRFILLRHDVDKKPKNSLRSATIENSLGINATYYFRIVPESFDEKIINEVAKMDHEIGYHYEDMDLVPKVQIPGTKVRKK